MKSLSRVWTALCHSALIFCMGNLAQANNIETNCSTLSYDTLARSASPIESTSVKSKNRHCGER